MNNNVEAPFSYHPAPQITTFQLHCKYCRSRWHILFPCSKMQMCSNPQRDCNALTLGKSYQEKITSDSWSTCSGWKVHEIAQRNTVRVHCLGHAYWNWHLHKFECQKQLFLCNWYSIRGVSTWQSYSQFTTCYKTTWTLVVIWTIIQGNPALS